MHDIIKLACIMVCEYKWQLMVAVVVVVMCGVGRLVQLQPVWTKDEFCHASLSSSRCWTSWLYTSGDLVLMTHILEGRHCSVIVFFSTWMGPCYGQNLNVWCVVVMSDVHHQPPLLVGGQEVGLIGSSSWVKQVLFCFKFLLCA